MFCFHFHSNFSGTFCLANSGEPGQMPHSVASDLGLHCLCMSHKKEARLIWVNNHGWQTVELAPKRCNFILF